MCEDCQQYLCSHCDANLHKKGTRKHHNRSSLNENNGGNALLSNHMPIHVLFLETKNLNYSCKVLKSLSFKDSYNTINSFKSTNKNVVNFEIPGEQRMCCYVASIYFNFSSPINQQPFVTLTQTWSQTQC